MKEKNKTTLRIPTKDQYAYVEIEVNATPEEAMQIYEGTKRLIEKKAEERQNDKPPF